MMESSFHFNISILCLLIISILLFFFFSAGALCANQEEIFIYDAQGSRNPFIPLIDKDSPTGIRTSFMVAKERVKLPVEIKIEGILWNGEEYFSILNGQVKKKGGNLDKIKIKEIKQDKIILEYSEKEFTVFFKKDEPK